MHCLIKLRDSDVMGKIVEITNGAQERAFDLVREPDALYLYVKCSDVHKHSKIVKIKLSDVLYQIWRAMTSVEKHKACKMINSLIAAIEKLHRVPSSDPKKRVHYAGANYHITCEANSGIFYYRLLVRR